MKSFDIAVIGGGASGFFAAIRAAEINSGARIVILEKTGRPLSKVRVSGGGRCNVTHHCPHVSSLVRQYPRGGNALKKIFSAFQVEDTVAWFSARGVQLKTEADGRMFPISDSSQTIIDCFIAEAERRQIGLFTRFGVRHLTKEGDGFVLENEQGEQLQAKKVLIATGGYAKAGAYQWLLSTGHSIHPPVPSLFTFNSPQNTLKELAGISVPRGLVKIEGTRMQYEGPILITHWGFSGPAVLKLSAFGAEWIHEQDYRFHLQIRWVAEAGEENLRAQLLRYQQAHPKRQVQGYPLFDLPQRLWQLLCLQADIAPEMRWLELSKKNQNKLVEGLFRHRNAVKGKTTFKDEFVTCGGIPLHEIKVPEMESRLLPGLYFAGEVLNVDGITGGFNFQHAWTTGWLAGTAMAKSL